MYHYVSLCIPSKWTLFAVLDLCHLNKKTQMSTSSFARLNSDSKWLAILNYWKCLKQRAPQNAYFCGSWTDISNISSCKRKSWGSWISSFHHYTCWITRLATSTTSITIHTCNSMRALNGTSVSDIKSRFMVTKREHKAWMCLKTGSLKTNNRFLRTLSNTHWLHWSLAGPQMRYISTICHMVKDGHPDLFVVGFLLLDICHIHSYKNRWLTISNRI